ncbi:MAG: lipocalin family protein [Flavobacteriales bacterium]|nr:lipocalin family protein [Flavobacteriales bacterium]
MTLVTAVNYGQVRNDTSDINVEYLAHVWHLTSSDGTQKTYSSTATNPHGWGATIQIHENGEFVDAYSARCGNDQNIRHDTGKWTLDKETMTLTTTFMVLFKKVTAEYQIMSLSDTELVLKEIETPAANTH